MDNQDYVNIQVLGRTFQVYRKPDIAPKQMNPVNSTKVTRRPRICYHCRNPGHKIIECPFLRPSVDARIEVNNTNNDVPQSGTPPGRNYPPTQRKHHEKGVWNYMDGISPMPIPTPTIISKRMDNLEEAIRNIRKEIADMVELLQLRDVRKKSSNKRKKDMQENKQATSKRCKKPSHMTKEPALHLSDQEHGDPSGTSLLHKDFPKIPPANRSCFSCRKKGHLIASCPEASK